MNKSKTLIAAAVLAALIAPVAYVLAGSSPLPAQTPPPGLQAGQAQVKVAEFAPDAPRPAWLGLATVADPAASIPVAVPRALSGEAPSSGIGRVEVIWRAWCYAPATGAYTVVIKIAGTHVAVARVHVDGQARNVAEAFRGFRGEGDAPTTTAAGSVRLAAGWHEITIYSGGKLPHDSATVALSRAPGTPGDVRREIEVDRTATAAPHTTVTLAIRAPGTSAAVPLVPYWPSK